MNSGLNQPQYQVNKPTFGFQELHQDRTASALRMLRLGELGLLAITTLNHLSFSLSDKVTRSFPRDFNATSRDVVLMGNGEGRRFLGT